MSPVPGGASAAPLQEPAPSGGMCFSSQIHPRHPCAAVSAKSRPVWTGSETSEPYRKLPGHSFLTCSGENECLLNTAQTGL